MINIGTDIVQIDRIALSLEKYGERFLDRFLRKEEAGFIKKTESIAGYWAAKEAAAKALGCGIGSDLGFHDISIEKDRKGSPVLLFRREVSEKFHIKESSVSISHDGNFAIAVAVIVTE